MIRNRERNMTRIDIQRIKWNKTNVNSNMSYITKRKQNFVKKKRNIEILYFVESGSKDISVDFFGLVSRIMSFVDGTGNEVTYRRILMPGF